MDEQPGAPEPSPSKDVLEARAKALELVCAMAMSLPSTERGPLLYPPLRTLLVPR